MLLPKRVRRTRRDIREPFRHGSPSARPAAPARPWAASSAFSRPMPVFPAGSIPIETVVRVAEIRHSSALERAADLEVRRRLVSSRGSIRSTRLRGPSEGTRCVETTARGGGTLSPRMGQTWQDLNRPLSFALRLEKADVPTVALVIVVAALNSSRRSLFSSWKEARSRS